MPAIEEMLMMMRPQPRSIIPGRQRLMVLKGPVRLTLKSLDQSCIFVLTIVAARTMPVAALSSMAQRTFLSAVAMVFAHGYYQVKSLFLLTAKIKTDLG